MQLHRAQQFTTCAVDHLPGLFRKRSKMDWELNRKVWWHELDDNVRRYEFDLDGQQVVGFYNTTTCFFGIPNQEGFRPLSREQLTRLKGQVEAERAATPAQDQETQVAPASEDSTHSEADRDKSKAQAEIGKLITERPNLTGAQLAANSRKIRELARKHGIETPVGI